MKDPATIFRIPEGRLPKSPKFVKRKIKKPRPSPWRLAIGLRLKQETRRKMEQVGLKELRPFCKKYGIVYTTYISQEQGYVTFEFIERFCEKLGINKYDIILPNPPK